MLRAAPLRNEYHNRLGIDLPNTFEYLQTVIRHLPDPTERHIMVYESLTHGGDASHGLASASSLPTPEVTPHPSPQR